MVANLTLKIPCSSSQMAEALAIREGLLLACLCLCKNIILESNNLELMEAYRSRTFLNDEDVIINDLLELKKSLLDCALVWAPQEANQPANHVAKMLLARSLSVDWLMCKPQSLASLLHLDLLA